MARKKISEYRAKVIVHDALALPYVGREASATSKVDIKGVDAYVVKVDQAVKGRFKKGLVALDVTQKKLDSTLKKYGKEGYEHFIIEPYLKHDGANERYLNIQQTRDGLKLAYSSLGGVDIESNTDAITTLDLNESTNWEKLAQVTGLTTEQLEALVKAFKENYFTFLEINPYLVTDMGVKLLDLAVEVDDAGISHVTTWSESDIREPKSKTYEEEKEVRKLDKGSMASFSLSVINPQGSIFLLLSGGGASVTIADEITNLGFGKQLANYGEYSGAPMAHETKKYTDQVLKLLVSSKASKKILFIGGAVANFTDVALTFAGVIEALKEKSKQLAKQNVTVYVRRGGPHQEVGLANMRRALEELGIFGGVYDPSVSISQAVEHALEGMKK